MNNIVAKITKKHNTNNPFEIAEHIGIRIVYEDYPAELNGVYQYYKKTQHIYINRNLSYLQQKAVCAHELGHALLHRNYNCTFLKAFNWINRFEIEANIFATYLLLDKSLDLELENLSYNQVAAALAVPEQYVRNLLK